MTTRIANRCKSCPATLPCEEPVLEHVRLTVIAVESKLDMYVGHQPALIDG